MTGPSGRPVAALQNREVWHLAPGCGENFAHGWYVAGRGGHARIAGPYKTEKDAEYALASGVVGVTP